MHDPSNEMPANSPLHDKHSEHRSSSPALAVSVECGRAAKGDVAFEVASERADSDGEISAEGNVAAFLEGIHGAWGVQDDNEVRHFDADLESAPDARKSDRGGSRPF